jgi:hypothetical protein
MRLAASVERDGAGRHQLDGLAVVLKCRLVLIERGVRVATVIVGRAVIRRERDGAVEILHRLVGMTEIHQRIAAVVVDRGVLRRDMNRLVEIVDGFLVCFSRHLATPRSE